MNFILLDAEEVLLDAEEVLDEDNELARPNNYYSRWNSRAGPARPGRASARARPGLGANPGTVPLYSDSGRVCPGSFVGRAVPRWIASPARPGPAHLTPLVVTCSSVCHTYWHKIAQSYEQHDC